VKTGEIRLRENGRLQYTYIVVILPRSDGEVMGNKFGGEWTEKKLVCVRRYLDAYATAMKKQAWVTTWYIDAFAGCGYVELQSGQPSLFQEFQDAADASDALLVGSALQSLQVMPSFDQYLFIEKSPRHARSLEDICHGHEHLRHRIQLQQGDANELLPRFCNQFRGTNRGVLFLDPFGMEIDWTTLQAVANTEKLDVWYLVSIDAINRMLPRSGEFPDGWEAKLTRYFGTPDWKDVVYQQPPRKPGLFDAIEDAETIEVEVVKSTDFQALKGFVLKQLGRIFRGGVANNPKWLLKYNGTPLFLLCFAVSNPDPKANSVALDIAKHILEMP